MQVVEAASTLPISFDVARDLSQGNNTEAVTTISIARRTATAITMAVALAEDLSGPINFLRVICKNPVEIFPLPRVGAADCVIAVKI